MSRKSRWLASMAILLFSATLLSTPYAFATGKQQFTGEVGDAMCGKKHMEGTPAECTRSCVSQGSRYALIVGEKVYILDASDKTALAALDQLAGKNATVTGTLNGDIIAVSSVIAAR